MKNYTVKNLQDMLKTFNSLPAEKKNSLNRNYFFQASLAEMIFSGEINNLLAAILESKLH